ncbi:MAG TPA: recombinase RecT [Syntrophales bacterium]|nr:recombinase RecT [Syntrophales bacterium]
MQTQITPTNTNGLIGQVAANKEIAGKKATPATLMNQVVNSSSVQEIIRKSLGDNAGAFTASVIDLYSTDTYLQKCDPGQVMRECLKAVSLKLPINKQLGFAYIIPYDNVPTFQIGYKGLVQLCMRTGAYRYINAGPVYEGELVKADKLSGSIDLSGEKTSDVVIGYFAYIETLNGFSKTLYWPMSKLIDHAKKYSKSYKAGNKIWKDNFDEMATKTVLRNLLSHWGVMSVEMETAFNADNADIADQQIVSDQPTIFADGTVEDGAE